MAEGVTRKQLLNRKHEYESELSEALRAVARLQGALVAINDLLEVVDGQPAGIQEIGE